MIAYVSGAVIRTESNALVVETGGLGYRISVTPQLALASKVGQKIALHTEMIVREDAQSLYGFVDVEELNLFQALLKVTGVGPKSALAVLGTMGVAALQAAVIQENEEAFKSVPGVGPKTAKLICVQLSGRFKAGLTAHDLQKQVELLDALTGLGYSQKAATDAIKSANVGDMPIAEALRLTLATLSRKAPE